jgi:hypothetical protein
LAAALEEDPLLGFDEAPEILEVEDWLVDELEFGVVAFEPDGDPGLPALPVEVELWAKAGIAARARLLEKRREINCRERFMILRDLS